MTRARWPLSTCVWELTLACPSRCLHCGSDAGRARPRELDTGEGLALIADLAALGCRSVTLSGGEPLLRRDWPTLGRAVRAAGMKLEMITSGLGAAEQADEIARTGFSAVTLSIDGPAEVHDLLRGVPGALARTLEGARALHERGLLLGAATQINRRNVDHLGETLSILVQNGFSGWQVQLTMPHGRARAPSLSSPRGERLCLVPDELPALEARLVALQAEAPFFMQIADNIGYMGRHEPRLRTGRGQTERVFAGCAAGLAVVGITSDGAVRGCLSMPASADEGNVRTRPLAELWNDPRSFAYNRSWSEGQLGPGCRSCPLGGLCRGGCQSLCLATTGAFHDNTHCLLAVARAGADGR